MSKIIKNIFLPLALILMLGSCNEDPEYYTLDVPADQMKITASAEKVILNKVDESKEAITFTWNKATDRGSNIQLVYYFRLYHAEMSDLQSELIRLDDNANSITWTVRQLNNVLHSWSISPDEEVPIVAEVLAVPENSPQYMKPEISKIDFTAIGFDPSNKLYLTVDANGQKRNVEMNMLGENVFSWKG